MPSDLKEFTVHGPFDIPVEKKKTGRMVATKELGAFWESVGAIRQRRGVYVFGMRAGKGITPIYIGKAAKQSFEWEVFTDHKRANHYNPALLDRQKGTPVMFLLAHPIAKGAINKKLIDQIETFFIDVASMKNPGLSNVRKKPDHKWRVRGVVRAKPGEGRNKATRVFKTAVGLD